MVDGRQVCGDEKATTYDRLREAAWVGAWVWDGGGSAVCCAGRQVTQVTGQSHVPCNKGCPPQVCVHTHHTTPTHPWKLPTHRRVGLWHLPRLGSGLSPPHGWSLTAMPLEYAHCSALLKSHCLLPHCASLPPNTHTAAPCSQATAVPDPSHFVTLDLTPHISRHPHHYTCGTTGALGGTPPAAGHQPYMMQQPWTACPCNRTAVCSVYKHALRRVLVHRACRRAGGLAGKPVAVSGRVVVSWGFLQVHDQGPLAAPRM